MNLAWNVCLRWSEASGVSLVGSKPVMYVHVRVRLEVGFSGQFCQFLVTKNVVTKS